MRVRQRSRIIQYLIVAFAEVRTRRDTLGAMRHRFGRRSFDDPLRPLNQPTWLIARNSLSQVVEVKPLEPLVDLRATLNAEREVRIAAGWAADAIGARCAFFFCTREGKRVMIGIERQRPGPVGSR